MNVQISGEDLAEILTSEAFMRNLRKAGNITYRTSNEAGFRAHFGLSTRRTGFSPVEEGTYFGMAGGPVKAHDFLPELDDIILLDVHFHPELTGPTFPSDGDIHLANHEDNDVFLNVSGNEQEYSFEARPVVGIAKIREGREIQLLLYQEQNPLDDRHRDGIKTQLGGFLRRKGLSPIEDPYESDITTQEVASLLGTIGYNSCVLNYPPSIRNRSGRRTFRDSALDSFAETLHGFGQVVELKPSTRSETFYRELTAEL